MCEPIDKLIKSIRKLYNDYKSIGRVLTFIIISSAALSMLFISIIPLFYNQYNIVFIVLSSILAIITMGLFMAEKKAISSVLPSTLLIAIILSISIFIASIFLLSNLYGKAYSTDTYNITSSDNSIVIESNLYESEGRDFFMRGSEICQNIKINNKRNYNISFYIKSNILTPNGERKYINNTTYDHILEVLKNNSTIITQCEYFSEIGLNRIYNNFYASSENTTDSILEISQLKTGVFIMSEQEAIDYSTRRNLIFIFALATVPVVISSIKMLDDLYRIKRRKKKK